MSTYQFPFRNGKASRLWDPHSRNKYSGTSPVSSVHYYTVILNLHMDEDFNFRAVYLAKKNAYGGNCSCSSLKAAIFPKDFPKEIFNCESLWTSVFRISWLWIFGKCFEVNLLWEYKIHTGKYTSHEDFFFTVLTSVWDLRTDEETNHYLYSEDFVFSPFQPLTPKITTTLIFF